MARVLAEVLPGTTVRAMSQTRDLVMFMMRKLVLIEPIYQRGDRDLSALIAMYTQQLVAVEQTPAYWPTLLRVDTRVQDAALSLYVYGVSKIPQWEELCHDVEEWMSGSEDGDLRQRLAAMHRLSVNATRLSEAATATIKKKRRAVALVVTRKRLTITAPPQQDRMPETVDDALAEAGEAVAGAAAAAAATPAAAADVVIAPAVAASDVAAPSAAAAAAAVLASEGTYRLFLFLFIWKLLHSQV
jgi:hypothetical protein